MGELLGLLVLGGIVALIWNAACSSGKHAGSQKGYGVGFDRGRRGRGGSACFVATAVFVQPEHPALRLLRRYRDETLMRTAGGQAFVASYYRVGPYLAGVVRRAPALRQPIRRILLGWCWKHRRGIRRERSR